MATISKRGTKYRVQVRRKGQSPVSRSFIRRQDAVVWANQMEVQADRHDLPADNSLLDRSRLRDLVERYRDTVTPRKKVRENEAIVLNAVLRRPICRKTLRELQTADFAAYRDERLKTIKPTTLKRELSVIRNMFEVAKREWGFPIKENPIDGLRFKAPDQRRERRLRGGEYGRLIEAARSRKNPYIIPIIQFAIETGMRRGEILSMKWDHVDLQQRSVLIPVTKNGHARTIPISTRAADILREIPMTQNAVFPVSGNAVRLSWARVVARAGIDDLHFHDLRHEAVSRFFELGLTTPEVALISGHRDMRMLFRYSHPRRATVVRKLDPTSVNRSPLEPTRHLPSVSLSPTRADHPLLETGLTILEAAPISSLNCALYSAANSRPFERHHDAQRVE